MTGAASAPEARVRAHFLKLSLAALDRSEPALREVARARLSAEIAAIDAARSASWLPIEQLLAMAQLAEELGGTEAARRVVLETMKLATGSALWGRFIRATLASLGITAPAAARWAPLFYRLAFRGTGRMKVCDVTAQRATVIFRSVPVACLSRPSYVRALRYALEYFFVLSDSAGDVRVTRCEPAGGVVEFQLELAACEGLSQGAG